MIAYLMHISCIFHAYFLHISCIFYAYFMHIFAYCIRICTYNAYLLICLSISVFIFMHYFAFCCIFIAYSCICLHTCTYSYIDNAALNVYCFCNPTSWTTRTLSWSLCTTTGSHPPLQALSHRTHHQSLQPLPSC